MTARDVIAGVGSFSPGLGYTPLGNSMAEKIVTALTAAGYSIVHESERRPNTFDCFKEGMAVEHSKAGRGIVTKITAEWIYVEYDRPDGKKIHGSYNAPWFEIYGHLLRALPDGGVDG